MAAALILGAAVRALAFAGAEECQPLAATSPSQGFGKADGRESRVGIRL